MTDLKSQIMARAKLDEKYSLKESYAHCQSNGVKNQIKYLKEAEQTIWFAGHHAGFHFATKVEISRLLPLIERLAEELEAAETALKLVVAGQTLSALADNPLTRLASFRKEMGE